MDGVGDDHISCLGSVVELAKVLECSLLRFRVEPQT